MEVNSVSGKDIRWFDGDYIWYVVNTKFPFTAYSRGFYKNRYYVTLELPNDTTIDDVIVFDAKDYESGNKQSL